MPILCWRIERGLDMIKNFELFTISRTDSIHTAMLKITANRHRAVVVLDGNRVVGTVSDGDIRRALLKDMLLLAPVDKIMNVNCLITTEGERDIIPELMRREKITLLPIVDDSHDLIDVALADEPFFDQHDEVKRDWTTGFETGE